MKSFRRIPCTATGLLVLAAALVATPAFADGGCAQWNASGQWSAVQANSTYAHFRLEQSGSQFHGEAEFSKQIYEDDCIGVSCDYSESVTGPIVGTIQGDTFEATVYWSDNSIGVYTGKVGAQGLIVGDSFDKTKPGTTAQWHSRRVMTCSAAAAPLSAKPTMALGRVQSSTPPDPTKTICDYARSARARNSPAAPNLERQCAAQGEKPPVALGPAPATAAAPTVALGRVQSTTPSDPTKTICDHAKSARARNSPAAPNLERQCNAYLAANPVAPAPAAAPVNVPAAPSPPVEKPHDLRIGRITLTQDGQRITWPVLGKPVAIACSYVVNEAAGPFVFKIQPWQGQIQIGGQVLQTLLFQGDIHGGQHEARQIWTPSVAGKTSITCALNPGFEDFEALPNNNRRNDFVDVVVDADAAPPAQ